MKTQKTGWGWTETTTKHFRIKFLEVKPFMKVGKWIESNKRLHLYEKRKKCNCCKKPWGQIDPLENMYLVFTDKGNKMICSNCYAELKEKVNDPKKNV